MNHEPPPNAIRIKRTRAEQRLYVRRMIAFPHVGYAAELQAAAHLRSINGRLKKFDSVEVWVDGVEKFPKSLLSLDSRLP